MMRASKKLRPKSGLRFPRIRRTPMQFKLTENKQVSIVRKIITAGRIFLKVYVLRIFPSPSYSLSLDFTITLLGRYSHFTVQETEVKWYCSLIETPIFVEKYNDNGWMTVENSERMTTL